MNENTDKALKPIWKTFAFWRSLLPLLTQIAFKLFLFRVQGGDAGFSFVIFIVLPLGYIYPFASIFFSIDAYKERAAVQKSIANWMPIAFSVASLIWPVHLWGYVLYRFGRGIYYMFVNTFSDAV